MQDTSPLIRATPAGLYCEAGDFYVDPWEPVRRAVITHAHADHARRGSDRYLTTPDGRNVLRTRLGGSADLATVHYGETLNVGGVKVSLHPAGHILGSVQVRIEHAGEVCVVSGDYKADPDPTCRAFEPLRCDTFVTESTFGLPIYRWPPQSEVFDEINRWWRGNREEGRASLLFAYALGKAQRILAGVDASIGPIYCHGAVDQVCRAYRAAGVELPAYEYAGRGEAKSNWAGALVLAPPSALGTPWMRKFGDAATAFASGWMLIRGARRRRSVDRGFVLSDHADWPALLQAIRDTEAERVLVTHGHVGPLVGWLREQGIPSEPLATRYEGERDDADLDDGSPEDLAAEAET